MKAQEKSDREKAVEWWGKLPLRHTYQLWSKYKNFKSLFLYDQIEEMWRKEMQEELKKDSDCCYPKTEQGVVFSNREESPQVDFKMLHKILDKESCYREVSMDEEELDNLKLFLNLLSKSSTFAHKAHKELQKLQK